MTTKTLELNNIEQKIFWLLSTLLALVFAFYIYSWFGVMVSGVDRISMNTAAHQLAEKASALESEYLSQANGVTLAYAESLGFSEVNAKFAKTSTSLASLALAK